VSRLQRSNGIETTNLGKGQGAVLAKKGQFASYKEKLEKRIPISFNTFKTL
jgi:hypothetical protein